MKEKNNNVLFITSDQQHWFTLGYLNPEVKTPNLDRLAEMGISFHRAYTPNPTCTPTRACWITGQYPSQHGAYSLGTKLPEDRPTVGDEFRRAGYATGLVGKAHFQPLLETEEHSSLEAYPHLHDLEFWKNYKDIFYGFEDVKLARNHTDESHVGQHYALWMIEKGYDNWRDYFRPNFEQFVKDGDKYASSKHIKPEPGEAWDIPEEIHYNTWIAEETNNLMEKYSSEGKNFFLWASFFDPHPDYMIPEPYASMYDPVEVTVPEHTPGEFDDKPPHFSLALDPDGDWSPYLEEGGNHIHGAGCHTLSREVRAKNIATMYGMMTMMDKYIGKILNKLDELGLTEKTLVCFTTDHGDFLGHHGLTKKAVHHYEDLLKVPMIISQPGTVPQGVISESLQSTVDVAPSFLKAVGLPVPSYMTGVDETSVWFGEKETLRDHVIVENRHQPTKMYMNSFITKRYKLTVHYNREYGELYDLQEDPGELVNLWDHADKQQVKQELMLQFLYGEMGKQAMHMPRVCGA